MSTPDQVKASFYNYLAQEFGPGFADLVDPPAGVKIGERVLYLLVSDQEAQRADTQQANREIEEDFTRLAARLSEEIDGMQYYTEPIVSSGLPYPRAVDIPHVSNLALGNLAVHYATSPDELPEKNFSLLWLFGVIFTYSTKYLLYLDFTHPKLRVLFVAEYDVEFEFAKGREIPEQLKTFTILQAKTAKMVEDREDVIWAKLVQIDTAAHTMIKTTNSNGHSAS
jgi:hypothetical protein